MIIIHTQTWWCLVAMILLFKFLIVSRRSVSIRFNGIHSTPPCRHVTWSPHRATQRFLIKSEPQLLCYHHSPELLWWRRWWRSGEGDGHSIGNSDFKQNFSYFLEISSKPINRILKALVNTLSFKCFSWNLYNKTYWINVKSREVNRTAGLF